MRIVIAEDSAILRDGMTQLLAVRGHEVVAGVGDADGLREAVERYRPEVAVIDIRMPPSHTDEGLRAAVSLRRDHPGLGVLLFSQYVETRYATDLLAERAEGVGYLLKERVVDIDEFVDALRRVAAGGTALDPEVVTRLLGGSRRGSLGELSPPGARGAVADGRGADQRGDRPNPGGVGPGGGKARGEHLHQAGPAAVGV